MHVRENTPNNWKLTVSNSNFIAAKTIARNNEMNKDIKLKIFNKLDNQVTMKLWFRNT